MTRSEKIKKVAGILKRKIPDLNHEEAIVIAWIIVEALDSTSKVEVNQDA